MRSGEIINIGGRIAHIRAYFSQKAFADLLGIPLRTYQNYERNEREPDLRILLGLWDSGWNINWLLTGEGPERLEAMSSAGLVGSHSMRLDRGILKRSTAILAFAVEMSQVKLNPAQYAEFLADIYDELQARRSDDENLMVISQSLKEKLFKIQGEQHGRAGSEIGREAGAHTGQIKEK